MSALKHAERLTGVHSDLVRVVNRAAELYPHGLLVVQGLRTLAQQRAYFHAGKSKTMRSRHLTGHAVDLAPILDTDSDGDRELSWDHKHFHGINEAMQLAGRELNVSIEWGGDWKGFVDMPHFQLPWRDYPHA